MTTSVSPGDSRLAARLRRALTGDVLFDAYSRGRYSTDASPYQIEPLGVVVPKTEQDLVTAVQIAADAGIPLLPRGAGTSQNGQAVAEALVLDTSKYLTQITNLDLAERRVTVQSGLVLEQLNRQLAAHGLCFPVAVATGNRATLGGMAGNNSSGTRSLRYGPMLHHVQAIDAVLADGSSRQFTAAPDSALRWLIGSQGTLAAFTRLTLNLQALPAHQVLGVCCFPTLPAALASIAHIVTLDPSAVELVDGTLLHQVGEQPLHRPTVERLLRDKPAALLLVEFAGEDHAALLACLRQLAELLGDLALPGSLVEVVEPALQQAVWAAQQASLSSLLVQKDDGRPVSFIADSTVALADLADYTERLNALFDQHGTTGIWHGHAAVGCLHVRPILNLKHEADVGKLRAITAAARALAQDYQHTHAQIPPEIKQALDPRGLFNPDQPRNLAQVDTRNPLRYRPDYQPLSFKPALDWSAWGGLAGAAERCDNSGTCRKHQPGVMCPSYRVSGDEQHAPRGQANTLRLALSGQFGPEALTKPELRAALDLCVSCKGCKRECPTGVDMARMKIEVLHQYQQRHGLRWRERLVSELPHYAPLAARVAGLLNWRNRSPWLAGLGERLLGLSRRRALPEWRRDPFDWQEVQTADVYGREVVLWVDTFNTYFEPENARAALKVLQANGCHIRTTVRPDGRPLCCGRTLLAAGRVEEARREAERLITAFKPFFGRGVPIVGLEPACLLTLRDEIPALLPSREAEELSRYALLLEQFLAVEHSKGRLKAKFKPLPQKRALVHGHCHQKAFNTLPELRYALRLIPGLQVDFIESGCCGMAGAFGYEAEHYDLSMQMAEQALLPAVRAATADTVLVANGTSCRRQIQDGSERQALHVAQVLAAALAEA